MRAVIADEWAVLRGGVSVVLGFCGVGIAGQFDGATAALGLLRPDGPDLFVIGAVRDQQLPGAVRRAKSIDPAVRVVVLVPQPDRDGVLGLLDGGADALLSRTASEDELRDAVERVGKGERFIAPGLLAMIFGGAATATAPPSDHPLTERERGVLALLVEGRSNREIAAELFIGEATVKTHLHHLYEKLDVSNRVQAVSRAIEMRLLY